MPNGPIDLSIVNRSTGSTYWVTANGVITPDSLSDVKEQSSDNSAALNSLPTPLARFFVASEAFRRVAEDKSWHDGHPDKNKSTAGLAYKHLVSDCLDLYELLFNLKYHRNIWQGKEDIEIREWDAKAELSSLSKTMPILYRTLNNYYWTDVKEDKLFFIIYKDGKNEYLLGSSSPYTGWVTPPDIDKEIDEKSRKASFTGRHYNDVRIKRKSTGYYFDGELLFEDRDASFQNYMYHELFGKNNIDSRYSQINSYIKSFEYGSKVSTTHVVNVRNITSNNGNVIIVNGISMGQNDEIDVNSFFQPCLIVMPYRLSSGDFKGASYEREDENRDYDYLIPLNSDGMSLMEKGATCVCQKRSTDVVVKLNYNGHEYLKYYESDPCDSTRGKIKDLGYDQQYVNVGLFPNILSTFEKENNYFKVAIIEQDSNENYQTLDIDKCTLAFYKKDNTGSYYEIEEVANNGKASNGVYAPSSPRTRQVNYSSAGTKYYELFDTYFDAMEICIDGAKGMVIPQWRKAKQTNDSYTYAVDLGTSNTFISRAKNGEESSPSQLVMSETMTSYLHAHKTSGQFTESYFIEETLPDGVRESIVSEFAPPSIDGRQYSFPIRTALCHLKGTSAKSKLFDNTNIAFFYEKALQSNLNEILTDIKWEDDKDRLSVFVQELLLIIKADVLQNNGLLSQTNIVRFSPLSFDSKIKRLNDDIWKSVPEQVFGVKPSGIKCYTESEAPYYYFVKDDKVKNTDSVSIIDIGGGSTDFVYFKGNNPLIASSVHFGCDELWGEGHGFKDSRNNGIFKKYGQTLIMRDNTIAEINSAMIVDAKVTAKNIINFWLTNQKYCDIKDNLRDDYSPLFVYHFTSLIYYMASMYKYKGLDTPRTIVFSGNGSRYIDNFITDEVDVLQDIIKYIFEEVYQTKCLDIYVTLPQERKESTCYGGLYRGDKSVNIPEVIYHGVDKDYDNAKELKDDATLQPQLLARYRKMNDIYKKVLSMLKNRGVIDNSMNLAPFTDIIDDNYENYLTTHFRSEVTDRYKSEGDVCNDAVFFIPVIDKIVELTKVI